MRHQIIIQHIIFSCHKPTLFISRTADASPILQRHLQHELLLCFCSLIIATASSGTAPIVASAHWLVAATAHWNISSSFTAAHCVNFINIFA